MKIDYFGIPLEVEEGKDGEVEISIYVGNHRVDMTEFCVWTQNEKGETLYSLFAKAYAEYWRHSA